MALKVVLEVLLDILEVVLEVLDVVLMFLCSFGRPQCAGQKKQHCIDVPEP